MSFSFDVMSKAWATLRERLPPDVRDSEYAERFGFLIEEMHEANHRLRDAVNHDERVSKQARKLDQTAPPA